MKKPPDLDGFFCGNSRTGVSRTVPITIGNTDYTGFLNADDADLRDLNDIYLLYG